MSTFKMKIWKCRINENGISWVWSENNIVLIFSIEADFSVALNSGPTIHQTQFPLMLAFVHKVQGLTLPNIAVSFNLNRHKKFSYVQLYGTLSTMKTTGNLYIEDQVAKEAVSVDSDVKAEYCRLK